jgi:hypothetical protein
VCGNAQLYLEILHRRGDLQRRAEVIAGGVMRATGACCRPKAVEGAGQAAAVGDALGDREAAFV